MYTDWLSTPPPTLRSQQTDRRCERYNSQLVRFSLVSPRGLASIQIGFGEYQYVLQSFPNLSIANIRSFQATALSFYGPVMIPKKMVEPRAGLAEVEPQIGLE